MTIAELKEKVRETEDMLKREALAALKEAFTEFFDNNPNIEAVRWNQYAPSFNDGEPCTFHVYGFTYKPSTPLEDEDDSDGGFFDTYAMPKDRRKFLHDFEDAVSSDQIFLYAFGNDCQVTVTRKGFEIDECYHD